MTARRLFEIERERLLLDFEKIGLLTSHPTTLGAFREARLRELLRTLTPGSLRLRSGFAAGLPGSTADLRVGQSRQIDCLVYDGHRSAPVYEDEQFAIVDPSALYAAIEVKSTLTFHKSYAPKDGKEDDYPLLDAGSRAYRWAGTLVDSFENIKAATQSANGGGELLTAIFAYDSTFEPATLYNALDDGGLQRQLDIGDLDLFPRYICSLQHGLVLLLPTDFSDPTPHHDEYTSFFNFVGPTKEFLGAPLHFFCTMYHAEVGWNRHRSVPMTKPWFDVRGLAVEFWSRHFDLRSRSPTR